MSAALPRRLDALEPALLRALVRGIEKEGLRVRPDATLAMTPHPRALGSALTHPHITTDFSEAQLELVTGVHPDPSSCIAEAVELHQVVHRSLVDETMWAASMPCRLPDEDRIPIARYGSSNSGTAKSVYRTGLSRRYGRRMQTICGIHYNFSLPGDAWTALADASSPGTPPEAFRDSGYFALIRNFRRHSWLLLYLFGASPAVCRCFVENRAHPLAELSRDTLYLPHATSLRMGPLGYQSDVQSTLTVSYNSLADYASSLHRALTEPYPPYEAIGIVGPEGYRQLSATLLQIENEFYGTIRPKRRVRRGERPLKALAERGVEYVEVRCVDIDPFLPVGIDATQMRFLDVFLLHALLDDSPPDSCGELSECATNRHRTALRGREPGLRLARHGREVPLAEWARELVDAFEPVAEALDAAHGRNLHRQALVEARGLIDDPSRTASARALDAMARDHGNSFVDFAMHWSRVHREALLRQPLAPEVVRNYEAMAAASREEQRRLEDGDTTDFETWRRAYIEQDLLAGLAAS